MTLTLRYSKSRDSTPGYNDGDICEHTSTILTNLEDICDEDGVETIYEVLKEMNYIDKSLINDISETISDN